MAGLLIPIKQVRTIVRGLSGLLLLITGRVVLPVQVESDLSGSGSGAPPPPEGDVRGTISEITCQTGNSISEILFLLDS